MQTIKTNLNKTVHLYENTEIKNEIEKCAGQKVLIGLTHIKNHATSVKPSNLIHLEIKILAPRPKNKMCRAKSVDRPDSAPPSICSTDQGGKHLVNASNRHSNAIFRSIYRRTNI